MGLFRPNVCSTSKSIALLTVALLIQVVYCFTTIDTAQEWYETANESFEAGYFIQASQQAMKAIALGYSKPEEAFILVQKSHHHLGNVDGAFLQLAKAYIAQGDSELATSILLRIVANPSIPTQSHDKGKLVPNKVIAEAHYLLSDLAETTNEKLNHLQHAIATDQANGSYYYAAGVILFKLQEFNAALKYFQLAHTLDPQLKHAFANIVYLETRVMEWSKYDEHMKALADMITNEIDYNKQVRNKGEVVRSSFFVDPHMLLAFPIDPMLKLEAAKETATFELNHLTLITKQKVYEHKAGDFSPTERIRIGFLSADFKLKATAYLVQGMFQFFDRNEFEVFCYANTPNSPGSTRKDLGLDFRQTIESTVEHFVDVSNFDSGQIVHLIHDEHKIHILIDFDGYSNNGIRASGVFPLQPAPLQASMLVYVGTTGTAAIQYVVTDEIASPPSHDKYFSENFLYLSQSFFVNSHAHIPELRRAPLVWRRPSDSKVFRLCNFNKHLKISPRIFRLWCDAMSALLAEGIQPQLLLLEFPAASKPRLEAYMRAHFPQLAPVQFLPFEASPLIHQARIADLCDVVVDNPVYGAHTMAVDTLWGGTPLVVWGGEHDFGGRVGESIVRSLEVPELVALDDDEYRRLLVRLATDGDFYDLIRTKIAETQNPDRLNAFWDTARYVGALENGFKRIWKRFMDGHEPAHSFVDYSTSTGHKEL